MRTDRMAFAVGLLLALPAVPSSGQAGSGTGQAQQRQGQGAPAQATTQERSTPSAESMGVSLKAIRAQLKQEQPASRGPSGSGMRYDFFVDVLGKRPPIDFFKNFDLKTSGGTNWGTPTHQEILDAMSPYWVNQTRPGGGFNLLSIGRKK